MKRGQSQEEWHQGDAIVTAVDKGEDPDRGCSLASGASVSGHVATSPVCFPPLLCRCSAASRVQLTLPSYVGQAFSNKCPRFCPQQTGPISATLVMTRPIKGPRDIELDLEMVTVNTVVNFRGSSVIRLRIHVSQYPF